MPRLAPSTLIEIMSPAPAAPVIVGVTLVVDAGPMIVTGTLFTLIVWMTLGAALKYALPVWDAVMLQVPIAR